MLCKGDDIDECAGPNICQLQVCTNTEGSFTCGCEAGYVLDSDSPTCSGKSDMLYLRYFRLLNIATEITCSALPDIENGVIAYSSDTTEPYDYGTTATYECDTGYELTSGDKKSNCTKSGVNSEGIWNGTIPTCSGIVVCEFIGIWHNHGYV